ncbi:MAG: ATP-binding cassette domain-containing protein, partial [Desulfatirhabdiaceae bacterium]
MIFDLRDVSFSYGAKQALNNLSLSIDSGLFYGILGPNGSGKTTLIDLLIRHIHPQSGQISFLGKPLNDYGRRHLAREIAL